MFLRTPDFLYSHFYNIPLARALPDVLHDHGIPCPAHLSAPVEALHAAQDNHHHDLVKDLRIRQQEPALLV